MTVPKKAKGKKQTRYVSRFAVSVPGLNAVIDMLRYDTCYPTTEVEASKLSADQPCVVRLTMAASSDREPSRDRWASFGCVVLATWGPDDVGPSDSELEGRLTLHKSSSV